MTRHKEISADLFKRETSACWRSQSMRYYGKWFFTHLCISLVISVGTANGEKEDFPMNLVSVQNKNGAIEVRVGQRPVLVYNINTVLPPEGEPEHYKRSGFIHPLYSPRGEVLTDDFPVGHTHQHGLFFAWTRATFLGDQLDFWNQHNGIGTVKHIEVLDMADGSDAGVFKVRQQQVSLKHGPVLEDIWTVRVLNRANPFVIDFDIEQRGVTEEPVILDEYHYGGFAFRGRADWNEDAQDLFNSPMKVLTREGKSRDESNHTRPGWIASWGVAGDKSAGVAIMDHPGNFRYPQPVRVHPRMPYLVFSPPVLGKFVLQPGKVFHARYRVVLFDGEPETEILENLFLEFGKR